MSRALIDFIAEHSPNLTKAELDAVSGLLVALMNATHHAQQLPSSLDGRARALIVTKLQEAGHWCIELTRAGS